MFDVEWWKGDNYTYVVHQLTTRGRLHRGRYATPLCPSSHILIESCTEPLDPETVHILESARERARARRTEVLEKGNLAIFDDQFNRP